MVRQRAGAWRRAARGWVCVLVRVLLWSITTAARADLTDEIQVYADDINAPGQFHLELHLNTTPDGRSRPDYAGEITPEHGIRLTPEFSYGLTPDLEAGLYVPMLRASGGSFYVAGARARLKWLPLQPNRHAPGGPTGAFAGLNFELSQVAARFERDRRVLEIRPIIGWRNPAWLVAFNPVLDVAFAGPDHDHPPEFAPALKVARTVNDWAALGVEYYLDLGQITQLLPYAQQSHMLFIAADIDLKPWAFNFGVGRGFGDDTDRWTVKAIIEVPDF
jgi:hypothetical protein